MDRRKANRFTLQLPCYLAVAGPSAPHLAGQSENISRLGILIRCADYLLSAMLPGVGEDLDIDLELPRNVGLSVPRSLHCSATVCEIRGRETDDLRIAAMIHRMEFRDLPQRFMKARPGGAVLLT